MPTANQSPSNTTNNNDIENPLSHPNNNDEIMQSIATLVGNIRKNKSVLSQIANWWGNVRLFIKISSGLFVLGPLLIIGVLTFNALLMVVTCVCTLLYTLLSLGLDNHYQANKDEHEEFKSTIIHISHYINGVVDELKDVKLRLSEEISRLSELMTQRSLDFEVELSKLKLQAETSQKINDVLGNMVKAFSVCLDENHRSHQELSESLSGHLNEILAGKECFFEALTNICRLEKELEASLARNEALHKANQLRDEHLYNRCDALVREYQRLDHTQKPSIGTQTEQLLAGIISTPLKKIENPSPPRINSRMDLFRT